VNIISRLVQYQLVNQVKANVEQSSLNPFYSGWAILNEVIGITTAYSVNLMYALNSLTVLMSCKKVDFNSRESLR
jgi:hypothetical protein